MNTFVYSLLFSSLQSRFDNAERVMVHTWVDFMVWSSSAIQDEAREAVKVPTVASSILANIIEETSFALALRGRWAGMGKAMTLQPQHR